MGSTLRANDLRHHPRAPDRCQRHHEERRRADLTNRSAAIVVTTIFEPRWLQGYLDNLRAHERDRDTSIYIIIDKKTPATVATAAQAAVKAGFKVFCPTLEEQE